MQLHLSNHDLGRYTYTDGARALIAHCLQITLLHLKTVRKLLSDPVIQHGVDVVEVRTRSLYDNLPLGQWRLVRQTLCRFFQNRRIKVGPLHTLTAFKAYRSHCC